MKHLLILFTLVGSLLLHTSCSKSATSMTAKKIVEPCVMDSLIQTVEGDQYGMQKYVIAYLKRGPNRDRSEEEAAALQKAHMQNIEKMAHDGKLVLAGPFLDDGEVRGMYVFNVPTIEEAQALTATDPAIQAGSLVMELVPWYGSAALQTLNFMHNRLESKRISEE